ncbi:MAG: hypothetical protein SGJ01_16200 [Gemmatimonadota bacterium]|nr:hypothetical protein [Gemmatimonadota bacterium]
MSQLLRNRRGFALEASLVLLVLIAALIGAAVLGSMMVQRSAGVDYRSARVNYAAEAGADNAMAQLEVAMSDGLITSAELAALASPTLTGFTITTSGALNGGPVPRTITTGSYTGLIGINQRIDITVSATDALKNRSDAVVGVNAQSIPLFQFGVFYEGDLEIHNGPPMTFAGWVHSNSNIYLSASPTNFLDIITTPHKVIHNKKWTNSVLGPININNAVGTPTALYFDSRSNSAAFANNSLTSYDSRLQDSTMGVVPLSLPLPTGMPTNELIMPRRNPALDTPAIQAVKMAWKADYHIVVDLNLLATPCAPGAMTVLPRAAVPNLFDCGQIFQGRPNAFLDGRENVSPDLLDINVGALMTWINVNPATRSTSIMYVTFINCNGSTACDYPAVRLVGARTLTQPWTIATDRPVYVWKNYNDIGWQPSAIMGDAVTFLSNEWVDANHSAAAGWQGQANTTEMWVYAAIAAGHSSTPCDWFTGCLNPPYGGGLENFPRFLENWGPGVRQMHYRGSLVSLFDAQYANLHLWNWRPSPRYYQPPNRDWQFDSRFRNPAQLPPGTPTAGNVTQISFRPVY